MTVRNLFLLPGDGIGPEAMGEVRKIIAYMNASKNAGFVTDEGLVGGSAYDAQKVAITDETMAKAMAAEPAAVRTCAMTSRSRSRRLRAGWRRKFLSASSGRAITATAAAPSRVRRRPRVRPAAGRDR